MSDDIKQCLMQATASLILKSNGYIISHNDMLVIYRLYTTVLKKSKSNGFEVALLIMTQAQ